VSVRVTIADTDALQMKPIVAVIAADPAILRKRFNHFAERGVSSLHLATIVRHATDTVELLFGLFSNLNREN
jgi:hypothetical protein